MDKNNTKNAPEIAIWARLGYRAKQSAQDPTNGNILGAVRYSEAH